MYTLFIYNEYFCAFSWVAFSVHVSDVHHVMYFRSWQCLQATKSEAGRLLLRPARRLARCTHPFPRRRRTFHATYTTHGE